MRESYMHHNPRPSVEGLRGSKMDVDEAVNFIVNERAKLRQFDLECNRWLQEDVLNRECFWAQLGGQVLCHYWSTRPSKRLTKARNHARVILESLVRVRWPSKDLELDLFGSTATGLDDKDSDVDLVIIDHERPQGPGMPLSPHAVADHRDLPEWYNPRILANVFRQAPAELCISDVTPLANARIPVVKLSIRSQGKVIKVDLVVNNRLGLQNTKLVNAYCDLRPTLVPPLVYNAKRWLRSRGLNDSTTEETGQHSLSSYAITLLVVDYLQSQQMLPYLQETRLLKYMGVPSTTIWTGFEIVRPSSLSSGAGDQAKTAKSYDATFFDPADYHHSNVVRSTHGAAAREYSSVHFRSNSDVLKGDLCSPDIAHTSAADIASRRGVGFHTTDYQYTCCQQCCVGRAYGEFIDWFEDKLLQDGKHIFGVTSDSNEGEQPLEWSTQPIIIRDPFVTDLNVARNMKSNAHDRLLKELKRMTDLVSHPEGDDQCPTLARLYQPWKLGVALWELRKKKITAYHRGEDMELRHFDSLAGLSKQLELLDVGNFEHRS